MYTQSIFCQSPPLLDFVCSSICQVASSTCWSGSDGSEGDSGCEEDAASEHSARRTEAGAEVEPWGAAKQSMLIRSVLRAYPGHRHEQPRTPPPSSGSVFSTDGRQSSSLDQDWGASEFPYREFDSFPDESYPAGRADSSAHWYVSTKESPFLVSASFSIKGLRKRKPGPVRSCECGRLSDFCV